MKKHIKNFNVTRLVMFCLVMLVACKKENGDIVYSQRPASNNLFLSISGTGNLMHTQNFSVLSTKGGVVSVGLNLTKASGTDITAAIGVDTSKVSAYNAANNTRLRLLPAGNYDLQMPTSGLTVKAGNLFSADSVKVNFKNLSGLRASNYLLPVSILKSSGNTAAIVNDSVKTVYINLTLTDVKQPAVSITMVNGSLTALAYPVGAKGAANATPVNIAIGPVSPNNITVSVAADNAKIAGYGAGYTAFPDGSYSLSASSVVINAGQTAGTFNINIPDLSKFDGTKIYLLPVSVSKISGDDFALVSTATAFLQLSFNNLNNSMNSSPAGTSLLNRQAWKVSATNFFDGTIYGGTPYPSLNATDGDNGTDYISDFFAPGANSLIIDMGTSHNVKTIAYNKAYSNVLLLYGISTYPSTVKIYTSTNGTDWVTRGEYMPVADTGGSVSSPVINYINFYYSIPARYVRLDIPSTTGFSEVNIYE